eukprot:gene43839-29301_t
MLIGMVSVAFPLTLFASAFEECVVELRQKKKARARAQAFQKKLLRHQEKYGRNPCVPAPVDAKDDPTSMGTSGLGGNRRESQQGLRDAVREENGVDSLPNPLCVPAAVVVNLDGDDAHAAAGNSTGPLAATSPLRDVNGERGD